MNKGNLIKMKSGGHEGRALNAACRSQQEKRGFPPDPATTSCPQLEANKKSPQLFPISSLNLIKAVLSFVSLDLPMTRHSLLLLNCNSFAIPE